MSYCILNPTILFPTEMKPRNVQQREKNWARKAEEGRREKAQSKIWPSTHAQNSEPDVCQKQRAA